MRKTGSILIIAVIILFSSVVASRIESSVVEAERAIEAAISEVSSANRASNDLAVRNSLDRSQALLATASGSVYRLQPYPNNPWNTGFLLIITLLTVFNFYRGENQEQ